MAKQRISTSQLKPNVINFVDSGGSNFSTTSTSLVDITGVTTTYTTGSTAETIFVWFQGLVQTGTSVSANVVLSINGVDMTENAWYPTSGNQWSQFCKLYVANIPANTTATIKGRALVASTGTLTFNRSSPFLSSIKGFAISQ